MISSLRARRWRHHSCTWSRPCARCMRVRGPPHGASPVSRQRGPRRGCLPPSVQWSCPACHLNCPTMLMQSQRCSSKGVASHMSVMHWNVVLISADLLLRYPSGGGQLRGAPGEEWANGQTWLEGVCQQTLPSTSNIVSQPTRVYPVGFGAAPSPSCAISEPFWGQIFCPEPRTPRVLVFTEP
jgi:hypothetical protein